MGFNTPSVVFGLALAAPIVARLAVLLARERAAHRTAEARRVAERSGRVQAERRQRAVSPDEGCTQLRPIGFLESVFKQRNGTPRQGELVPLGRAKLKLLPYCNAPASLEGLDSFSHCWIIFVFHENTNLHKEDRVKAKIMPPRLCGAKVGLFATRTPHRPCPVGLSVARVEGVAADGTLCFSGVDLLDGTPVLDVKPYVGYDRLEEFRVPEWIVDPVATITIFKVDFVDAAEAELQCAFSNGPPSFSLYDSADECRAFIVQALQYDLRSLHRRRTAAVAHEVRLDAFQLACEYRPEGVVVTEARLVR
eukprot:TRINITY_DN17883_c0_g1_i2.p1 TRINITY_DN17883_c0_g1~~TRINITY_DN17883_c0_g1_i2.p1  ORF type:complete len:308 (+),score=41.40 TRINITY_DN17883_c0_g1_i2:34-957(+)